MRDSTAPRILVIDDDKGLLRLIQGTLRREGFLTAAAESGKDAIRWLQQNEPALMVLDLKLPDIEGKDLIAQLATTGRKIPFIIITGQGDERVAVEMMKRGALDYLVKDVQFLEFVPTVVRRALSQVEKEKRLAEAEKQARLAQVALEQSCCAMMILSQQGPGEIVHYVNPAFSKLTDCSAEKLVGKSLADMAMLGGPWDWFRRVLSTDAPFVGELQLSPRDGPQITVDCTITQVLDDLGAPTHWVIMFRDVTDRKQLERELIEMGDRQQLGIACDLHDGLGQHLTALELYITRLQQEVQMEAPRLIKPLKKVGEQLREATRQTRRIASGLFPISLHADGLESALSKLAASTREMAGVDCRFKAEAPRVPVRDTGAATQLYRIAQEAVNNALKHGRAKAIRISLAKSGPGLALKVTDDGEGFPALSSKENGIGLRAMKYRADLIGAALDVASIPQKGTKITCTWKQP